MEPTAHPADAHVAGFRLGSGSPEHHEPEPVIDGKGGQFVIRVDIPQHQSKLEDAALPAIGGDGSQSKLEDAAPATGGDASQPKLEDAAPPAIWR